MVRISRNKVYIKILYWGIKGSGKTTILDILYNIIKENERKDDFDLRSTGELIQIPVSPNEGFYSDRGIFQSAKKESVFFHVYTFTTGQNFEDRINKNFFLGTDGIVFVFDGQRDRWEENVESLKELKTVAGDDIIKKIPLIIMLNKVDLENVITVQDVEVLLQQEGLLYPPGHELAMWNPIIFPSIAVVPTDQNVYRAFIECARRTGLYQTLGRGAAPKPEKTARINLVIPEALKNKWERFSSEVVHASMSQMIRDAVREYMKKMKQTEQQQINISEQQQENISENQEDQDLEKKIERIVAKKLEEISKKS